MKKVILVALLICCIVSPALADSVSQEVRRLHKSAYAGNLDQVRFMLANGVPVDAPDEEKHTALMWAGFNGHTAVVTHLLQSGANVDARDVNGRTALMFASSGPFVDTVEVLLKNGADVNVQGKLEGFTALMTAAAEGQADVVRLLLKNGADAKLEDSDGDSAEKFARDKGHAEVIGLLKGTAGSKIAPK